MPYHNKKIDQQPESHDITLDIPTSLRSEITTSVTNPHNTWRDTCGICDTFATETRQHPLQWPGERDSTRTPAHAEALVSICSAEKNLQKMSWSMFGRNPSPRLASAVAQSHLRPTTVGTTATGKVMMRSYLCTAGSLRFNPWRYSCVTVLRARPTAG